MSEKQQARISALEFSKRVWREQAELRKERIAVHDEEFAQFVFAHFGGYWLHNNGAHDRNMQKLPQRIADRVTELAREYELKRGGP